jgi:hypothetical protein
VVRRRAGTQHRVLLRLGGTELERVRWPQLVGSGDGQQAGAELAFFGVARIGDWSLIVEDNGRLGTTDAVVRPLSAGTTVVSLFRGPDGHGRFLVLDDQRIGLDFDLVNSGRRAGSRVEELGPMVDAAGFRRPRAGGAAVAAGFALAERLTAVPLTHELLAARTYLLSSVSVG